MDLQSCLYPYLGGVVRNQGGYLLEIGGMSDHIHMLIHQSSLDKFSHQIRDLKANSSLWIHQNFSHLRDFAWQEGYGSFSVSHPSIEKVREYIKNQEEHHRTSTFEEEYKKFPESFGSKYDERFVLG